MKLFWFRRDLRLEDNVALYRALSAKEPVLPVFIFDTNIIDELPKEDARITFIYQSLHTIHQELESLGSGLLVLKGKPLEVIQQLVKDYPIKEVYSNRDYEPYALQRDQAVETFVQQKGIGWKSFKDQVIFEPNEILKSDGLPYTVFTPYKNAWLKKFNLSELNLHNSLENKNLYQSNFTFPTLSSLGFEESSIKVLPIDYKVIPSYAANRDIPSKAATSNLGPHLRFGTVSVRSVIKLKIEEAPENSTFLSELIWREFFMQILFHFPHVVQENFRSKYDGIKWLNREEDFEKWCEGKTGYPIVDAGMRQLNETGYMHNRVRMITAGFLCKHLLIDWRWGEAYFASKLLDYELASNNGNWQWSAGTGCDAAPYFRIFNPSEQTKKFDPALRYINQWVPELNSFEYPKPMVEHKFARKRALAQYKEGIIA